MTHQSRFSDGDAMDRVTFRVPEWMADAAEQLVETGEYPNKSEIHREALKEKLEAAHE